MHDDDLYHNLSTTELLTRVSTGATDTPDWVKSNAELNRRADAKRAAQGSTIPSEKTIADPLSEVTRKERRILLTVDVVLIAVVVGDLVPTQIESLGITVSAFGQVSLLSLLVGIALYLLIGFTIYAFADITAWREDSRLFARQRARALLDQTMAEPNMDEQGPNSDFTRTAGATAVEMAIEEWPSQRRIYKIRVIFEFWVPILVTVVAISLGVYRISATYQRPSITRGAGHTTPVLPRSKAPIP